VKRFVVQGQRRACVAIVVSLAGFGGMPIACEPASQSSVERSASMATGGGDSLRAPALMREYGCGSCHRIPGVAGAVASVGPPLDQFATRSSVAGTMPNTAINVIAWIEHPQRHHPGSLMPEMDVNETDARDIAAFLSTLR
jgi:cytochrome c1